MRFTNCRRQRTCIRWSEQSHATRSASVEAGPADGELEGGWKTEAMSTSLLTMPGSWVAADVLLCCVARHCSSWAAKVTNPAGSSLVAYRRVSRGVLAGRWLRVHVCWDALSGNNASPGIHCVSPTFTPSSLAHHRHTGRSCLFLLLILLFLNLLLIIMRHN